MQTALFRGSILAVRSCVEAGTGIRELMLQLCIFRYSNICSTLLKLVQNRSRICLFSSAHTYVNMCECLSIQVFTTILHIDEKSRSRRYHGVMLLLGVRWAQRTNNHECVRSQLCVWPRLLLQ